MPIGDRKKYKFQDPYLKGCEDALETLMSSPNGVYYRVVHDPIIDDDDVPQNLQEYKRLTQTIVELPSSIPPGSSLEDQWKQVSEYSLSFNVSEEKLAIFFNGMLGRRKNESQKKRLLEKKGNTIRAFRLTPKDGKIQTIPDENGHLVFQPYEDFKLEDHIEYSFKPRNLSDYENKER